MIDDATIVALYTARQARLGALHAKAREISMTYGGDFVIPLPEMDANEQNTNANMLYLGLEQNSMRVASVLPFVTWPSVGVTGQASEDRARNRRDAQTSWWEKSAMGLIMRKRARSLAGYAMAPVVILPNPQTKMPCWYTRDVLNTFPADTHTGDPYPSDVIFVTRRPYGWIRRYYPDIAARLRRAKNAKGEYSDDTMHEILEFLDGDEYVQLALGSDDVGPYAQGGPYYGETYVRMKWLENRTGMPLAVVPRRISLDDPQGQFDQLLGMFQMQAKLAGIEMHGMARAVWPETWAVSGIAGEVPQIVSAADPMAGQVGVISGGQLTTTQISPTLFTNNVIDRLERNQRVQGGVPAEFGGESASNVRTGRRGQDILSNTVDPYVQEAHEIFQHSLRTENRIAAAIDKAYFPGTKQIFVQIRGKVIYDTADTWETDENFVRYAQPGVDQGNLVVGGGQRVGLGTMSKQTFMEIDPLIDDPEFEHDRIVAEAIEMAVLTGFQSRAAEDPAYLEPLAKIVDKIRSDKLEPLAAFAEVHKELQAAQAAQAQAAAAQPQPGPGAPPEGQPGMAAPGAAVGPPSPSLGNLSQLLGALRSSSAGPASAAAQARP